MSYALSRDDEDQVIAAVRAGTPVKMALTAVGLTITSSDAEASPEARAELERLARRIEQAQALHQAEMIGVLQECAMTPNAKTGLPDWRAADAMLSKHPAYRNDWREHRELEIRQQGVISHEHRFARALDDDQLEEALRALPSPTSY
jgi:hypothetical protein